MSYRINEIFYTIQGEGHNIGEPAVFVRFSGCNLKCAWCDTDFHHVKDMSAEDIVRNICELWPDKQTEAFVVLTGGEPSLQADKTLIDALHKQNCYIAIETNGTHELPEGIDWITCSPKAHSQLKIKRADEVKVVYDESADPEQWRGVIHSENWLLQPLHIGTTSNVERVMDYILTHPTWRLSVQLHKMIGFK